ncbi:MAG: hypothetical protein O2913_07775 [Chloroflexi bacterium]|nr:hypothetical protein [Chloroflexota bacterium]
MADLISERLEVTDDFEAVQNLYLERGWTDGLPVVPPTPERVAAMLAATPLGLRTSSARFRPTGAQLRWRSWR